MNNKVTYLPHVKKLWHQKQVQLDVYISEGKYEQAFELINELLTYPFESPHFLLQRLKCLNELHLWADLEDVADEALKNAPIELYGTLCLFYVVSLFEQEQYELLIDFIDVDVVKKDMETEQFLELMEIYEESKLIVNDEATKLLDKFQLAIISQNDREQWELFHQWQQLNSDPPRLFIELLAVTNVNPFVKTALIQTIQPFFHDEEVTIIKGDNECKVVLQELPLIRDQVEYNEVVHQLELVEQEDPTLHLFILEILQRYHEYTYPFVYDRSDVQEISEAVLTIARGHLYGSNEHVGDEEKLLHYIEEINKANEDYFKLLLT